MAEGEFRTERVLFHIVAQGSVEIDYEVGVETPEQAFRRVFTPDKYAYEALVMLIEDADDLDWGITCVTEPEQAMPRVIQYIHPDRGRLVRNGPALHPGPAVPYTVEDMVRREQFLAEQEELSQSLDQMLRGGRD